MIPKTVHSDITTSLLPHWQGTRLWILARPLTGFAETFSHYIVEVSPKGGSEQAETNPQAQAVLFVVEGTLSLFLRGKVIALRQVHMSICLQAWHGRCKMTAIKNRYSIGLENDINLSQALMCQRRL